MDCLNFYDDVNIMVNDLFKIENEGSINYLFIICLMIPYLL